MSVRRSSVHGRGVFALRPICAGELILEYTGIVMSWKRAKRRHRWLFARCSGPSSGTSAAGPLDEVVSRHTRYDWSHTKPFDDPTFLRPTGTDPQPRLHPVLKLQSENLDKAIEALPVRLTGIAAPIAPISLTPWRSPQRGRCG
ncbi:SET domain-containing protein-lysine N-methyltransferase [Paraburkholderia strydomiana]|uniref:SET domain-containing protein-lysine N-methyltransferase n=1 Tax=Paraburkholderia strydomiana TaxID=1245417 RepID=UPI0033381072